MAHTMHVVRAAKTLTWRESLAVSPLLFGEPTQPLAKIAKQTGITKSTLLDLFAPLAVPHRETPVLLTLSGLGTRKPSVSLHPARLYSHHFHLTKTGHLQYFSLGVRGEHCPLSPAANWLYWWWRSAIAAGMGGESLVSAARLSGVSQPAVLVATKKLVAMGWLQVDGAGDDAPLAVGDVNVEPYYPSQPARPARSLAALCRDAKPRKKRVPPAEQHLSPPQS